MNRRSALSHTRRLLIATLLALACACALLLLAPISANAAETQDQATAAATLTTQGAPSGALDTVGLGADGTPLKYKSDNQTTKPNPEDDGVAKILTASEKKGKTDTSSDKKVTDKKASEKKTSDKKDTDKKTSDKKTDKKDSNKAPTLKGFAHVQNVGWQKGEVATNGTLKLGTSGKALRMESIQIEVQGAPANSMQARAHVQNVGWINWTNTKSRVGTTGKAQRIEAIQIKLAGNLADKYSVWYRVHAENYGWLGWAKDGDSAGTSGYGLRLESLQVKLLPKEKNGPENTVTPFKAPTFRTRSHVQNVGWLYQNGNNVVIGTTGRNLRLEAFSISFGENAPMKGGIEYSTHVQNIGWQKAVKSGAAAGTVGRGLHIEAIKIKLTGDIAKTYDIWYRVHASNIGWMGWTSEGEAGTTSSGVKAEAIQIMLVKKTADAPQSTMPAFVAPNSFTASIETISNGQKEWSTFKLGDVAGTTGKNKALLGIKLQQTSNYGGKINYRTHLSKVGWTETSSNGAASGTLKPDNKVEAVKLTLSGEAGKYFDIYYRTHVSGVGWIGWAKNGEAAGTTGLSKNIEALQVRVVVKGGAAPGSTKNHFSDKDGFLSPVPAYVKRMLDRAQGFSSDTNYLILVDVDDCKIATFKGSKGNWSVARYDSCVCGAPGSPTIRGTYSTGYHLDRLPSYPNAEYCTNITGGYFFHSVLNSTSELGQHLSHGCVRLDWSYARYIQSLPYGTRVNLY